MAVQFLLDGQSISFELLCVEVKKSSMPGRFVVLG